MRLLRSALAGVCAAGLLASAAFAQPPRPGTSRAYQSGISLLTQASAALAGVCANSLSSIGGTLTTCTDFANGAYYASGAPASTFAGAGGTQGGCAITAGSGLQCTGTNVASIAGANPASNYCVISKAVDNETSTTISVEYTLYSSSANAQDYEQSSSRKLFISTAGASQAVTGQAETAVCVSSSGSVFSSIAGNAAVTTSGTPPSAASTLFIGNGGSAGNGNPNGVVATNYVQSERIVTLAAAPTASTAQTASTL